MNELPQDGLAALLHAAGHRVVPDATRMERARQNVHDEWRTEIRRRRNLRWRILAAASLAMAAVGGWLAQHPRYVPAVTVASASRVSGKVIVGSQEPLLSGRELLAGDMVETLPDGRVAIRWVRNAELRLDAGSLVKLESGSDVRLVRGAVYVETLKGYGPADITVHTQFGRVSHVGTRFEVRVSGELTRVRVRDGAALFSGTGQPPVRIDAGQQLLVSGGMVTREVAPPAFDREWDWTASIAPRIQIEGRVLSDVLAALCSESGMQVRYATAEVRERARRTILHGSIDGLDARSAVPVVLAGTDLAYELHPDRVEIFAAEPH
jgi:hypothetical protein